VPGRSARSTTLPEMPQASAIPTRPHGGFPPAIWTGIGRPVGHDPVHSHRALVDDELMRSGRETGRELAALVRHVAISPTETFTLGTGVGSPGPVDDRPFERAKAPFLHRGDVERDRGTRRRTVIILAVLDLNHRAVSDTECFSRQGDLDGREEEVLQREPLAVDVIFDS